MKLTDEQYRALEPYEQNMRTALHQGYARNPGSRAIDMMQGIYNAVAKVKIRPNKGCNTCILNLLKDCGRLYFADKTLRQFVERAETPDSGHDVTSGKKSVRTRRKVSVKMKSGEPPRDIQPPIDMMSLYEEF